MGLQLLKPARTRIFSYHSRLKTLAAVHKTSYRRPPGSFCIRLHILFSVLHRSRASQAEMKVVAAYLLAVLGGNTTPSAEDLKGILGSVGAETDDDRIQLLLSEVKGKDITELIASGREKLASVPSGGGAVAVAAPGGGGGAAAAPAAAEPKKEEKVEEKEDTDDDMGFSLFD
ncbi:60S acidic ribosomal protein P2B-like [Prunus yedoensis var. nudiflora]|uniref:60S acidic ribosomal protein P2B-like n=1 Tax=Prunus yedoensis var. nudiflora TaxID=2094558 RepID=A0A314UQ16_PRUYE|nr:60S acidic ribosomal protein P2B-like [Prunus yedoensis var. nudiflora]